MSRSKKDAKGGHRGKGAGWEYWSRRPFSGYSPSRWVKRKTHQLERKHAKIEIRKDLEMAS